MYATWLMHTHMCHNLCVSSDFTVVAAYVHVTWLIHWCDMAHQCIHVTWLMCMLQVHRGRCVCTCDVTHPLVRHESSMYTRDISSSDTAEVKMYDTWRMHSCDMTHPCVIFFFLTWRIHSCDMTHPCVIYSFMRHDSSIYATWLIHIYVWHDSSVFSDFCLVTANVIFDMTHSFMRLD